MGATGSDNFLAIHGLLSRGGLITQMDVPGVPVGTIANAIDDCGTIVGCGGKAGFICGPLGVFSTFSVAHAFVTCASGVQTSIGTVVGYFTAKDGYYHGFVYKFATGAANPGAATQ